jgi:hypothetical protein
MTHAALADLNPFMGAPLLPAQTPESARMVKRMLEALEPKKQPKLKPRRTPVRRSAMNKR